MSGTVDLSPEHARLVRKLETTERLGADEIRALAALPLQIRDVEPESDIVREGDRPAACCLVLEGFVTRYKMAGEGQRQILSIHIPGEIPDLQSLFLKTMDHSLAGLTRGRVAYIAHTPLYDLVFRYPQICAALWRETLIDAAIFREWIASVGRRSARQRVAHMLCELMVRLKAVDLASNNVMQLPLTQAEVADATGLSAVHVNRVLQELRADGLIISRGKMLEIADWPGLKAAGQFDPAYLHMVVEVD